MNDDGPCPLSLLHPGETATILALRGGRQFQHRVISMGLAAGREIEMIRNRPNRRGGGPVVIRTGETRIMLGHGTSEHIIVRRKAGG